MHFFTFLYMLICMLVIYTIFKLHEATNKLIRLLYLYCVLHEAAIHTFVSYMYLHQDQSKLTLYVDLNDCVILFSQKLGGTAPFVCA